MLRGLIWTAVALVVVVPIALAAASPLLAWRQPVYIVAGFAGIIALAMLLIQPLLMGGFLPGLSKRLARWLHRWVGAITVLLIVIHVVGLWITSPPDVIDVLLFRSPTPFSVWGVVAMWAAFATAFLAVYRLRHRIPLRTWQIAHGLLALVIVVGTVVHALLVEGAMETISKAVICAAVLVATMLILADMRLWKMRRRS